jgi:catechol 2,3-dioxygenase-like lactoylglutathione lyase family enzyme
VTGIHHVELWVPDLAAARESWGWLLAELGWAVTDLGGTTLEAHAGDLYLFVEESPALSGRIHDRLAPGVNHLAFHAGPPARVDALVESAPAHGWRLLFADRHPHAGGPDHYAAYLENGDGYEVELVADRGQPR